MLKNRNIIIFGEDWGRFPSTTQHIGKVLLKFNRIMWVGSLAHRKPNFSIKDFVRILEKLRGIVTFNKKDNLVFRSNAPLQIHPFIIPFHDSKTIRKINERILTRTISKAIKRYDFFNPVLITSSPLIGNILGNIGETSSHYFCLDDYLHFDGAFKSLLELEKEMLTKISTCFAVSELLVDSKKTKSGRNYFLPQGVLIEHFTKSKEKIPLELRSLKKPVIGFFGLISEWIDLELIVFSAKKLPNFTFLVIGKPSVNTSIFNQASNIKFIGEIPFNELPNFASVFDVGIIPFKINELTIACNPLKLLEYLSLGIPVVSVNLPEVRKFKSHVGIADNYDDFVNQIKMAVQKDTEQKRKERLSVAEKYSWESITQNICEKILFIEKNKNYIELQN